mmetsp:Transcript_83478/g.194087  ORF Transcript_83478/g.194087 Transcript_83478/m.194087 type:complete len:231 (+) Transcript_83478:888-1580(+)
MLKEHGEDLQRRPAAQHAEQHQLAEDPHSPHDTFHIMQNLAVCAGSKTNPGHDHRQLRLDEGARAEAHGDHLLSGVPSAQAEGKECHSEDHEEGLHRSACEDLLPTQCQRRALRDKPATHNAQQEAQGHSRDDAKAVACEQRTGLDLRLISRRGKAREDTEERESEGGLQRGPDEDQAWHGVACKPHAKLLHLWNHQPVTYCNKDGAHHQAFHGRVPQYSYGVGSDGQDL